MLTYPVKINQSEGIPDPGIPERLFLLSLPTGVLWEQVVSLHVHFAPNRFAPTQSRVAPKKVDSPRPKVSSPEAFSYDFGKQ